jgi:hypothetical protein
MLAACSAAASIVSVTLTKSRDAVSVLRGPAWCGGSCGFDFEVLPGIRHDLAVAGVAGSFDSNDAIADFRVLFAEIFGEFRLGAGRANDQDLAGIADGVHHLREKLLVESNMTAPGRVRLVVNVLREQVWMQDGCDGLIYLMPGNSKTKSGAPVARRT